MLCEDPILTKTSLNDRLIRVYAACAGRTCGIMLCFTPRLTSYKLLLSFLVLCIVGSSGNTPLRGDLRYLQPCIAHCTVQISVTPVYFVLCILRIIYITLLLWLSRVLLVHLLTLVSILLTTCKTSSSCPPELTSLIFLMSTHVTI